MKVRELIALLGKFNPEAEVLMDGPVSSWVVTEKSIREWSPNEIAVWGPPEGGLDNQQGAVVFNG